MAGGRAHLDRFAPGSSRPPKLLSMNTADQLLLECCNVFERSVVRFSWRLSPYIGQRNDVQLTLQVIERQQPIVEGKGTVRQIDIRLGIFRKTLELPHHVVGKVADASAGERR